MLGYYFGEVDLLFGETRKHSYMAKTDCELLSLSKKNFTKIFFQDFKEIGAEIYNNALKRRVRAQKTYKEALQYCQNESKIMKRTKRPSKRFVAQTSSVTKANFHLNARDFSKTFMLGNKDILGLQSQPTEPLETQLTALQDKIGPDAETREFDTQSELMKTASIQESLEKDIDSSQKIPSQDLPSLNSKINLFKSTTRIASDPVANKRKESDDRPDSMSNGSQETIKSGDGNDQPKKNDRRSAWSKFKSMFGKHDDEEEEEKEELKKNTEQNKKIASLVFSNPNLDDEKASTHNIVNEKYGDDEIDLKENRYAKLLAGEQIEEEGAASPEAKRTESKKQSGKWGLLKNTLGAKNRLENGKKH